MARDGEILNSGILRRMADFLEIGGVRRTPSQLSLDVVQPVYDLSPASLSQAPAAPTWFDGRCNSGNFPAGATSSVGVNLLGNAAVSSFIPPNVGGLIVPIATSRDARVLSINCGVGYVAAGAAADALLNVRLSMLVYMKSPSNNLTFVVNEEFAVVESVAPYSYSWTFPNGGRFATNDTASFKVNNGGSNWDGYVPPGYQLVVELNRTPGTGFFPNLTSMDTTFLVATRPTRGDWKA